MGNLIRDDDGYPVVSEDDSKIAFYNLLYNTPWSENNSLCGIPSLKSAKTLAGLAPKFFGAEPETVEIVRIHVYGGDKYETKQNNVL
jgi:hypothetical protein